MSEPIVALIAIAMILIVALTLTNGALDSSRQLGTSFNSSIDLNNKQARTWLTGPTPVPTPGYLSFSADPQPIDVTFTNIGEEDIRSDFSDWDIIWELKTATGLQVKRLAYTSGTPAANEWAIKGIYQDADSLTGS